jgi:hypothetical protein
VSSARSRSDAAPLTIDAAAAQIVAAASEVRAAPRILIDGRSGSGKTTLAAAVRDLRADVQVVALDSLYPGWDGLAEGAAIALTQVLEPHAAGVTGRWRRWDWAASAWAEGHDVDPTLPLLVEGSGLLTRGSAAVGDVRVWVDADAAVRRRRAIARDGAAYEPHWHRWAAQEDEHIGRHHPELLATHRIRLR